MRIPSVILLRRLLRRPARVDWLAGWAGVEYGFSGSSAPPRQPQRKIIGDFLVRWVGWLVGLVGWLVWLCVSSASASHAAFSDHSSFRVCFCCVAPFGLDRKRSCRRPFENPPNPLHPYTAERLRRRTPPKQKRVFLEWRGRASAKMVRMFFCSFFVFFFGFSWGCIS